MKFVFFIMCLLWVVMGRQFSAQTISLDPFKIAYNLPINFMPVCEPQQLIDRSFLNSLFSTQVCVQIDPVHDAVQNVPQPCTNSPILSLTTIPSDNNGHCISMCRQYLTPYVLQPSLQVVEIFCLEEILDNIVTYSDFISTTTTLPTYMRTQCLPGFNTSWHLDPYPLFDFYSLQSHGQEDHGTVGIPNCLHSDLCWKSVGFPRTTLDTADIDILFPNNNYYCCRKADSQISPLGSVLYTFTCVTQLYTDSTNPNAVTMNATCTRIVLATTVINGDGSSVVTQTIVQPFTCNYTCNEPYYTAHQSLENYTPQPTSNGCSPGDYVGLCTLNMQSERSIEVCAQGTNEAINTLQPFMLSQLIAMGGSAAGIVTVLPQGTPNANLDFTLAGIARTWAPCQSGQVGCTPYCNCWNSCPAHTECSSHGDLYEPKSLLGSMGCQCDSGYTGDVCNLIIGNQLCNHGGRTSVEIDSMYYVF